METNIKWTPEQKEARRLNIVSQRKRAKDWALARYLRRHLILVAQEITVVDTSTDTISDRTSVIQELELQRTILIKELRKIDLAIEVVKRMCTAK